MVEKERVQKALKEVNMFQSELDRARGNVEDLELSEKEKEVLEDIREAGRLLEKSQKEIENNDLFST